MSTAAPGGTLRVTYEGVLGDGVQAYYATELRQSVLSVCGFDVYAALMCECHWEIAMLFVQME